MTARCEFRNPSRLPAAIRGLAIALGLILGATSMDAAKAPAGKVYFTTFFGLDGSYALDTQCFVFAEAGVCSHDGQICGSWLRQGRGGEGRLAFELSTIDAGTPISLSGEARIDTRGNRSSIGGAGLISRRGKKTNFSFAGREIGEARCLELLPQAPGGEETRVVGSGNVASEEREVEDFHGVVIAGVGRVVIRRTGSESLTVRADDNLLEYLGSEVRDGILHLGPDPGVSLKTENEILFEVEARELDDITASGVAGVEASGIETDSLSVTAIGVSAVITAGAVDRQRVVLEGVSAYDGRELASRLTAVDIAGVSIARVRVSEELTGRIVGLSILEYIGDPRVSVAASKPSIVRRIGG